MTEDEAKTKWCPFVRYRLTGTDVAVNCDDPERPHAFDEEIPFNCIASACMAWRWKAFPGAAASIGDPARSTTEGHCGLAGRS